MNEKQFFDNPDFVEYVRLLYQIDFLIRIGKNETEEGYTIYDRMDAPGDRLSRAEVESVGGISSDLNSLVDPPHEALPMSEHGKNELDRFQDLLQSAQYHLALDLLRKHERFIPPARLALERFRAWTAIGEENIAIDFLSLAVDLEPRFVLNELTDEDRRSAREQASKILVDHQKHSANLMRNAERMLSVFSGERTAAELRSTA